MKKRGWDTQRKEEREHPQYEACKLTYEHSGKPRALSREESLGRREKNKKAQHREEHDDSEKPFINPRQHKKYEIQISKFKFSKSKTRCLYH